MDLLYTIFIQPIASVMILILDKTVPIFGYGSSIIILSALVSITLIPIKKMCTKIEEKETLLQYLMYPALLEIRQKYSGEEQFYKMKALYKSHQYHPSKSFRKSLSLFMQLPFFIGAYSVLSTYQVNDDVFLNIIYLTKSDALLWGLNLMPILMSVISLAITIGASVQVKKQGRLLTAVFFVLLYNSPSGLILYWTMNLVFSYIIEQVLPK